MRDVHLNGIIVTSHWLACVGAQNRRGKRGTEDILHSFSDEPIKVVTLQKHTFNRTGQALVPEQYSTFNESYEIYVLFSIRSIIASASIISCLVYSNVMLCSAKLNNFERGKWKRCDNACLCRTIPSFFGLFVFPPDEQ